MADPKVDAFELVADLSRLSSRLEEAVRAYDAFEDPFDPGSSSTGDELRPHRDLASKKLYDALALPQSYKPKGSLLFLPPTEADLAAPPEAAPPIEPLPAAIRAWVAWLFVARVTIPASAEVSRARSAIRAAKDATGQGAFSYREAWRAALSGGARAKDAWTAIEELAPSVAAPLRARDERIAEAVEHLGLAGAFPAHAEERADAATAAVSFLSKTDDLANAVRAQAGPADVGISLGVAAGRSATEGWPRELTPRWLRAVLPAVAHERERRGIAVAPRLGPATTAASFMRALGAFGVTLGDGSSAVPFPLRRLPVDVRRERLAATFSSVLALRAFHVKVLGLSSRVAANQARAFAAVLLFEARLRAIRVLFAHRPPDRTAFDEGAVRFFGVPVAASLRGAWPSIPLTATAAFRGAVLAPRAVRDLEARYDEDWFRNPRAMEAMADLHALPVDAAFGAPPTVLDEGVTFTVRELEAALG